MTAAGGSFPKPIGILVLNSLQRIPGNQAPVILDVVVSQEVIGHTPDKAAYLAVARKALNQDLDEISATARFWKIPDYEKLDRDRASHNGSFRVTLRNAE